MVHIFTSDDKKYEHEANIFATLYLYYNDDNARHMDQAFESNGFYYSTSDRIHEENVSFVNEILSHGVEKEELVSNIPEVTEYINS